MKLLAPLFLFSLASVLQAATGNMQYAAVNLDDGLQHNTLQATSRDAGQFSHEKNNRMVSFTAGANTIKAALIYLKANGNNPDGIAVDLSGTGKFSSPIPFKPLSDGSTCEAGPAPLKLVRDGKTYPVSVFARYTGGKTETVDLVLGMGANGQCDFGGKTYKITILDTSQNLSLGDAPTLPSTPAGRTTKVKPQYDKIAAPAASSDSPPAYDPYPGLSYGDTVIVHAGTKTIKAYYGQPIPVDGAWYDVKFDPATSKVTAEPNTGVEGGYIQIPHNDWSVVLIGQKYLLDVRGSKDKVAVPADHYNPMTYTEHEGKAFFTCSGTSSRRSSQSMSSFDVTAGNTAELSVGSPLVGVPVINVSPKEVAFNALLEDSSGMVVDKIVLASGSRPSPPDILIKSESGSTVHTAKLEYG